MKKPSTNDCIYTANPDLNDILEKIKDELKKYHTEYTLNEDESFTLTKGPVRIILFAKEDTPLLSGDRELKKRVVP